MQEKTKLIIITLLKKIKKDREWMSGILRLYKYKDRQISQQIVYFSLFYILYKLTVFDDCCIFVKVGVGN